MKSANILLELGRRKNAAFGLYPASDHRLGAAPDQIACRIVRQRCQSFAREYHVKCLDEIRRRIDQGAVEVKDNSGGRHGGIASLRLRLRCKDDLSAASGLANFGYSGRSIGAR